MEENSPLMLPSSEIDFHALATTGSFYNKVEPDYICLVVTQHPSPTFYKDEGGKSNHMCASATVVMGTDRRKQELPYGSIAFRPRLVYESGNEVEDANEIFTILSIEPNIVNATEQSVVVKFRIEKVSRRKDGKKFKVCFDIDYDKSSQYRNAGIRRVLTNSVVVLSKRKNSITGTSTQPTCSKKKRPKVSKAEEKQAKTNQLMTRVQAAIKDLEGKISNLNSRVSILESENKNLKARLHLDIDADVLSIVEDEYEDVIGTSLIAPARNRSMSTTTAGMYSPYMTKFEDPEALMLAPLQKRSKSCKSLNNNNRHN